MLSLTKTELTSPYLVRIKRDPIGSRQMPGRPCALHILVSLERRGAQHGPIAVAGAPWWMWLLRRCWLSTMSGGVILLLHPAAHPQGVGLGPVFGMGRMVRAGTVTCCRTGGESWHSCRSGGCWWMVPRRQVGPVPWWCGALEDAARTDEGGQGWRRAGRYVTLVQA